MLATLNEPATKPPETLHEGVPEKRPAPDVIVHVPVSVGLNPLPTTAIPDCDGNTVLGTIEMLAVGVPIVAKPIAGFPRLSVTVTA